jgi:hypothetical protein
MDSANYITCPACHGDAFKMKYRVSYEYSYIIDANAPGLKNKKEFLPFLYDDREQKEAQQFLECSNCGAQYPCYFTEWEQGANIEALQRAVNAAH